MADNSNIYERKYKGGLTLQVQIKYGEPRKTFTRSIKVNDFPDKKSAYAVARMIRDKARIDIQNEKIQDVKVPTLEWFYKKHLELGDYSLRTKEKHDYIYNHSLVAFKDVPLDKIKTSDIQEQMIEYSATHSQDLVNRVIALWRAIYYTSTILGYDITDKTITLKKIKSKIIKQRKNTSVTSETFEIFCDELLKYRAIDGKINKASQDIWYMLQIMKYSGCRCGEALALNKDDYDAKSHILHINKSIGSSTSKKQQIINTKTTESVRDIPCIKQLDKIMESLIKYSKTSPLLTDENGLPYEIRYISTYIYRVSAKANLNFNAYMLRHLFSTTLFQNGINQAVIRDLMGHASETMSLGYANTSQEDRINAIEKIK